MRQVVFRWLASAEITPKRLRPLFLWASGARVGRGAQIESGVRWWATRGVRLGAGAYVNHDCFIQGTGGVTLGRRVYLAFGVRVVTGTHEIGPDHLRAGQPSTRPVVIEDGCWIGAFTTILPGVTIGRGSVVAAGSIVSRDLEPNGLYAGIPARRIRSL